MTDDSIEREYNPDQPRDENGRWGEGSGDKTPHEIAKERGITIPPAWTDVKVASDPKQALQVTGKDSKGRSQYIYTAEARAANDAAKFERVSEFSKAHEEIMSQVEKDMGSKPEAQVLYLIDKTGFRVGSDADTKADVKAYGASTLTSDHVSIDGDKVSFSFTGKEGVQQTHEVEDHKLAEMLQGREGRLFGTNDQKVRDYLHSIDDRFHVKDFRTHIATAEALKTMSSMDKPSTKSSFTKSMNSVCDHVASVLGNTRTMAKNSYIHPAVWGAWQGV